MTFWRVAIALLGTALCLSLFSSAAAAAEKPRVKARAWTLIDARTGEVLTSHAASEHLPIAGTTKLMTAWVVLHELPLDKILPAATYQPPDGRSLGGLGAAEKISVRDLLNGLILGSGNGAADALAVAAAGSQARFVGQMNRSAAALGLADTHYTNPVGHDQPGNFSSAADLATLAQRLLHIPAFARIADSRSAVLRSVEPPRRISTGNELLLEAPWVNGVETGPILGALQVSVGSGRRKGVELISVAIGAPGEEGRRSDDLELLEYGFRAYRRRLPVHARQDLANPSIRYSGGELALRAAHSLAVGVRRGQRLSVEVKAPGEVTGPIRRGAVLGQATVSVDGRRAAAVQLRAGRSIARVNAFDRARDFLANNLIPIALGAFVILMAAILLYRRLSRGNDEGERNRVNSK